MFDEALVRPPTPRTHPAYLCRTSCAPCSCSSGGATARRSRGSPRKGDDLARAVVDVRGDDAGTASRLGSRLPVAFRRWAAVAGAAESGGKVIQ